MPPFVLLSSESPGRRERLVVSVSEFMPHGEVLVAAAVFKGFISTLRINVRGKTSSVGTQAVNPLQGHVPMMLMVRWWWSGVEGEGAGGSAGGLCPGSVSAAAALAARVGAGPAHGRVD